LEIFELPIHFVQSLLEFRSLEGNSTLRTLDSRPFELPNCFLELGFALGTFDLEFSIVIDSCHSVFLSPFVSNIIIYNTIPVAQVSTDFILPLS